MKQLHCKHGLLVIGSICCLDVNKVLMHYSGVFKDSHFIPPQVETHTYESHVHPCARICVEALKDLCIEISLVSCHVMPVQPKLSPFTKAGFWLSLDR